MQNLSHVLTDFGKNSTIFMVDFLISNMFSACSSTMYFEGGSEKYANRAWGVSISALIFVDRLRYFKQLFTLLGHTAWGTWLRGPSKIVLPLEVFALFLKIARFESQNFKILTTFDAGFKSCFVWFLQKIKNFFGSIYIRQVWVSGKGSALSEMCKC